MTPAEVLRKAAALIQEHGWTKGEYIDQAGCLCVFGACAVAEGKVLDRDDGGREALESWAAAGVKPFLIAATGDRYPADWNDAPGRTQAEVIDALERAAVLAEAEASK